MSEVKAEDLRIGNWVMGLGSYPEPMKVDTDDIEFMYHHEDHGHKPIPLTEEWLLKFGFEKCETNDFYEDLMKLYGFYFSLSNGCAVAGWEDYYGHHQEIGKADSLHQLQNLYQSLTGEELKLTQPT